MNAPTETRTARPIARIVRGRPTTDGAGVSLTRVIGGPDLPDLDPFLLLDEIRADDSERYIAGFPNHPHRGFETVTYMLAGRMRHEDSRGHSGLLLPGSVQWMTAGRGLVHSEMPEQEDGLLWGFQLWVNLPKRDKMTEPRYQEFLPDEVPERRVATGATVRVVAGSLGDVSGPVGGIATDPSYYDVILEPGASVELSLEPGKNAFLYAYEGALRVPADGSSEHLARGELAVLGEGDHVRVETGGGAKLLAVAGRPIHEPVFRYGPFVMNTRAEILQAIEDFNAGRMR